MREIITSKNAMDFEKTLGKNFHRGVTPPVEMIEWGSSAPTITLHGCSTGRSWRERFLSSHKVENAAALLLFVGLSRSGKQGVELKMLGFAPKGLYPTCRHKCELTLIAILTLLDRIATECFP